MVSTDFESRNDETERDRLLRVISDTEKVISASGGNRPILSQLVQNLRGEIGKLEKKMKDSEAERDAHAREQAYIASSLAERESALSSKEKETFGGLLAKEFFTKQDFAALEDFYTKTWDRLSESGKDEMSHRVWDGVRRGGYRFGELPEPVQDKESERAYRRLRDAALGSSEATRIPASDRQDFIRAYEAGRREEAEEVLDRGSFKETMFIGAESKPSEHAAVTVQHAMESDGVFREVKARRTDRPEKEKSPEAGAMGEMDFSSLNLGDMKLAESSSAALPPTIADSAAPPQRKR